MGPNKHANFAKSQWPTHKKKKEGDDAKGDAKAKAPMLCCVPTSKFQDTHFFLDDKISFDLVSFL